MQGNFCWRNSKCEISDKLVAGTLHKEQCLPTQSYNAGIIVNDYSNTYRLVQLGKHVAK